MACEYCWQAGSHDPRCPNAEPEEPVLFCDLCKEPIYEDDYYYYIDFQNICECCFSDYADEQYGRRASHDE